ncbi:MAG: UDP-N-acetylmuramoyl-L-alanyl-D-glutamate--2,6-diaminopimelate ligase [Spirochaetia bacterium]|nr:UDP-N-acetylmuramoyl-L-alanyl-D-glutamate--2,6-diaminopimelate ligase [Spirochaetia bacterium]
MMPLSIQKIKNTLPETAEFQTSDGSSIFEISSLTDDSRKADSGCIFSATELGKKYLQDAYRNGCRVFLIPEALRFPDLSGCTVIRSKNFLELQGHLASELNGNPSEDLYLVGITGTNGKTSISEMLYHIWKSEGLQAGAIGTLGVRFIGPDGQEESFTTGYTTPRAGELQSILARMKQAGVTHVALEASSEALFLGRLEGCSFSSSIFINLTPEHLDFHKSMDDYFSAKMHLFDLTKGRMIVHGSGEYGRKALQYAENLSKERTVLLDGPFVENLPYPVSFSKVNASLAVLASSSDSFRQKFALEALRILPDIPGRFNLIPFDDESVGIVDYAHTPDALENVLRETRNLGMVHICVVFGCGGNRDETKRPLMGKAAYEFSDFVIVTDDNPRSEDPSRIRSQIIQGIVEAENDSKSLLEVPGRKKAVRKAVEWLSAQNAPSAVVLAGKGHENVQIFADHREIFSDSDVLREEFIRVSEKVIVH